MLSQIQGLFHLSLFYCKYILIFWSIPNVLQNPEVLDHLMEQKRKERKRLKENEIHEFKLSVPKEASETYNLYYTKTQEALRNIHRGKTNWSFKQLQWMLFSIRFLSIIVLLFSWNWNVYLCLFVSSLQFIIAPYSLFVATSFFIAVLNDLILGHYISMFLISWIANIAFGGIDIQNSTIGQYFYIPITANFIVVFLIVDQILCYIATNLPTGGGVPQKISWSKMMKHAAYGFINCKTYQILLLSYLCNFGNNENSFYYINIWILLIDYIFGLSKKISIMLSKASLHWAGLFYHQHRIAHLPIVYQSAHKFHHYLHDTTAFDAHIYGIGMPEEFFVLWIGEIVLSNLFGVPPFSFNFFVIQMSWWNKWGHVRGQRDKEGRNNHANHHTLHSKNFGIFNILLDLYFGTNQTDGLEVGEYSVSKTITKSHIEFNFKSTQ